MPSTHAPTRAPHPPRLDRSLLADTLYYADRSRLSVDPDASTELIPRERLLRIALDQSAREQNPNQVARDVIARTWPHASVRRTELVLDRTSFRKSWRRNRDEAIGACDVQTASTAKILVDAIDRLPPECLVACLAYIDGQSWELFVNTHDASLLAAWPRINIW